MKPPGAYTEERARPRAYVTPENVAAQPASIANAALQLLNRPLSSAKMVHW